ncbi:UDP-glucuronosyl/UDP-glucosyltransferase [Macleaya cordata]|uniref:UDP-glucuronosyl/UDP-glucosyltransferase n=1 Tax=Macleaya cordata TaxID=56857 RepID=A0A200QIV5_MACCD|nr:UDP-glucuronosyl/UDP-glucosyltransferase [Macleaya cordata]
MNSYDGGDQTDLHDQKQQQQRQQEAEEAAGNKLMMRLQQGGRRLVLFPSPLQGHLNPMLQLATLLHTKGGFSITVVHTRFNSPSPSNYPQFNFEPISDGIISSSSGADQESNITSDFIALITAINVNCVDPFRDCLLRLLSDDHDHIACIIADATMHFTQAVAESLQLPRIILRTSSITSFVAFAAFPLLLQKGYLPMQDSELEKPVRELPPLKVKDLPVVNTKKPKNLYELVAQMIEKARSSSGIIWNSFEQLEQPALDIIRRDFHHIPIFPIGPFHKWSPAAYSSKRSSLLPEDHSCISWLDRQAPRSVVYVSFGSLADMNETELVEMAWGLVNSDQPFLWVVRPGLVNRASSCSSGGGVVAGLLPDGFEEMVTKSGRGCLVKWAPQQQVLAHPAVGGFWTHSGWNSTLESVCEGVPMLCRPFFGDQMVNARFVSEVWKVGFQFENCRHLERGEVERAIRRLMAVHHAQLDDDDEEMRIVRVRVRELKEKADLCVKEGGSSIQSIECLFNLILSF